LQTLALGPSQSVQQFQGYIANGFRFHTREVKMKRKNQNSGIMVKGADNSREIDYYSVLLDIISLRYLDGRCVILFRCDWWDVHNHDKVVKVDKYGLILNVSSKHKTHMF